MTRRTRQLTTFLLTIALTFSMLPSAAWATDSAEPEPTVAVAETVTGSESEETANRVPVETAAAAQRTKVSTAAQKDGGTSSSADKQLNTCGVLATSSCDPNGDPEHSGRDQGWADPVHYPEIYESVLQ